MKIGILGLPQAGKTTLFQALTRGQAQATSARGEKVHLGSVQVPDRRLDHLGEMYKPKKFTPAKVDYVEELLSPERIRRDGLFDSQAVTRLVSKFKSGAETSVADNMALVGILSTELLLHRFSRG